jgi:tetratricopeptide (TPR) repeat protein
MRAVASRYSNLAAIYQIIGDIRQALTYYEKDLKITEQIGDHHGAAVSYLKLGHLYNEQKDKRQARIYYEKAKALFEMVGDISNAQQAAQASRRL